MAIKYAAVQNRRSPYIMWLFCLIILLSCRGVCQCHVTWYDDDLCKGIYCGIVDVSV